MPPGGRSVRFPAPPAAVRYAGKQRRKQAVQWAGEGHGETVSSSPALPFDHERRARRPGVQLLARREGQLRRRPGRGRAGDQGPSRRSGCPHGPTGLFLARVVRFLAGECEVRQFLDIGTGIPSANNTHEVAQSVAPAARIVYVDNDPVVLTHARALG